VPYGAPPGYGFATPTQPIPVTPEEGLADGVDIAAMTSEEAVRSGVYSGELRAKIHAGLKRSMGQPGQTLGTAPRHWSQGQRAPVPSDVGPDGVVRPMGHPTGPVGNPNYAGPPGPPQPQYPVPQAPQMAGAWAWDGRQYVLVQAPAQPAPPPQPPTPGYPQGFAPPMPGAPQYAAPSPQGYPPQPAPDGRSRTPQEAVARTHQGWNPLMGQPDNRGAQEALRAGHQYGAGVDAYGNPTSFSQRFQNTPPIQPGAAP
jgi:hypothetical protein